MAKRDEVSEVPNACADSITSERPLESLVPSQCEVPPIIIPNATQIQGLDSIHHGVQLSRLLPLAESVF